MSGDTFSTILMDPPWPENGGGGRGAQNHYPIHSVSDIAKIIRASVFWTPARDCHLWMWAPSRIHLAFELAALLGCGMQPSLFDASEVPLVPWTQITSITWVKMDVDDPEAVAGLKTQVGLGQYQGHDSELLLLFSRGKAQVPEDRFPRQTLFAKRQEHSRKPDEQYERIEWISPGPYLEMFARRPREGWEVWGNEIEAPA